MQYVIKMSLKMTLGIIIFLVSSMVAAEGTKCSTDSDCPENQFCYTLSFSCANYTACNRYHRQEGSNDPRNPSQCGPCLPGYRTENLTDGNFRCLKMSGQITEDDPPGNGKQQATGLPYIIVAVVAILVSFIIVACYFARKRGVPFLKSYAARRESCKGWAGIYNYSPSAPPLENGSFRDPYGGTAMGNVSTIPDKPPTYTTVYKNKKSSIDKNNLVSAMGYMPPNWITVNPNYEQQLNNEAQGYVSDQVTHPLTEPIPPDEDTNPSSWTPQQTTVQLPSRPFIQFSNEQRDNAVNNVLINSDNCPTTSNETNTGANTETGNAQSRENDHNRPTNILISQKFTMNLNLMNGDY